MKNSKQSPCSTCGGQKYNDMFEIPYVPSMVLADGGGIHIKPSHKGRFTEYKKRTGNTTEEALHSPDPHVRQMANFARNASHWKHQEGGATQDDQLQQLIMAYAQQHNITPQELMQKLQQLDPQKQQQMIQVMAQELSQGQPTEQMAYGGSYGTIGLGTNGIENIVPAINAGVSGSRMMRPLSKLTGMMGLATAVAGAGEGFLRAGQALGNKISGGKDNAFNRFANNVGNRLENTMNFTSDLKLPNQMYNPNPAANTNPVQAPQPQYTGNTFKNVAFDSSFSDNQNEYDDSGLNSKFGFEYGGYLPHVQFGGMNFNNFGQTADYADTMGYNRQGNPPKQKMFPGYNEEFDTAGLESNLSQAELQKQKDEDFQNMINQNNQMTEATFQKPFKLNTNGNAQMNMQRPGANYANKAIQGIGAMNNYFENKEAFAAQDEYDNMLKRVNNTNYRKTNNSINPFGNYTLNAGPANNFQLSNSTPIQDYGTSKYGGQMRFKEGGEYQISDDELLQLMRDGAEIEFIHK